MSLRLMALALMCQTGIHGKTINSVLGPYISYGERFYMCEGTNNRPLPWKWYLRASHFNPLKPNELQRLTGNLTIANSPFDDSLWVQVIVDSRSNNQWKENAFVFNFKNAYGSLKQNIPGFYERVFKRGEDIDARLFKTGVYELNNDTINWTFPNFPIVPYGYWRFRLNFGKAGNQLACWVVNARTVPKVIQ